MLFALVDEDAYLLEVCRYVDLNPVRAGLVKHAREWAWSSYRAHTEQEKAPEWLGSAALHRLIAPRAPRREGPMLYAPFVAQGNGVKLWEEALSGQIYLGREDFVRRMQAYAASSEVKEIPRTQRRPATQPMPVYFEQYDRDVAIVKAFLEGGYTQSAIAQFVGLSVSRVSRLIKTQEAKGKT